MKKLTVLCAMTSVLFLAGCAGSDDATMEYSDYQYDGSEVVYADGPAPYMEMPPPEFAPPQRMNYNVAEYNIEAREPPTVAEKNEMNDKWSTSRMETRWQEYRGTMVRIQILLGATEFREMRLRVMQNANGADVDGDARHILARVADFEMRRVCGQNAESYEVVYEKSSFEVLRPTPYFDYMATDDGITMREYMFRCIYN